MDSRYIDLAEVLIGFSTKVKKGENVLIHAYEVPDAIVVALIRAIRKRKAKPFVLFQKDVVFRELIKEGTAEEFSLTSTLERSRMKKMDAYLALRGSNNIFELSDILSSKMVEFQKIMKPVQDWKVEKTRWVVLRWPNAAMAQLSMKSTEAFEDLFFKVCTLDYARMAPGMNVLKKLMEKTDRVHIKGPNVDLSFSIKGIPAIPCWGQFNIPDGEIFTAPVKNSIEGYIAFNTPTVYQGFSFDNIRFEFRKGKIVKASASDSKKLSKILNSDKGARYTGEFAIGVNPHILEPMRDILFDEKIAGSFHLTPGQAYKEADNGNRSQVHWDLVCIQRPEYGGGEIYFDNTLIRKNGLFVPKSLQKLNPKYLLG